MPPHKSLKIFTKFQGLDTFSSDYTRGSGHASLIKNAMYSKQGTIKKRHGFDKLATSSMFGNGLFTFNNIDLDTGNITEELISISPFGFQKSQEIPYALADRFIEEQSGGSTHAPVRLTGFTDSEDGTEANLTWKPQVEIMKGWYVVLNSTKNYGPGGDHSYDYPGKMGSQWRIDSINGFAQGTADYTTLLAEMVDYSSEWHKKVDQDGDDKLVIGVHLHDEEKSTDYYIRDKMSLVDYSEDELNGEAKMKVQEQCPFDNSYGGIILTGNIAPYNEFLEPSGTVGIWLGSTNPPKPTTVTSAGGTYTSWGYEGTGFVFGEQGTTISMRMGIDLIDVETTASGWYPLFMNNKGAESSQLATDWTGGNDNTGHGIECYIQDYDDTYALLRVYVSDKKTTNNQLLLATSWIPKSTLDGTMRNLTLVIKASGKFHDLVNINPSTNKQGSIQFYIDGVENRVYSTNNDVKHYNGHLTLENISDDGDFYDGATPETTDLDLYAQGDYYSALPNGARFWSYTPENKLTDIAIFSIPLDTSDIGNLNTILNAKGLANTHAKTASLLSHYQCGRGSSSGIEDSVYKAGATLDTFFNSIHDMSGQSFGSRHMYFKNRTTSLSSGGFAALEGATRIPEQFTTSSLLQKNYTTSTIANKIANPTLTHSGKLLSNISNINFENPSIAALNDCLYIAGASNKKLLKYDGHSLYQAGIQSTWDVDETNAEYEEPLLFSATAPVANKIIGSSNTSKYNFQGYDEVMDVWKTQASYKYKYRKVHVDAKGHRVEGKTSAEHDTSDPRFRVDTVKDNSYDYIGRYIPLTKHDERGSFIIGADNSANEVYTLHDVNSDVIYTNDANANTSAITDIDTITQTGGSQTGIHCEIMTGDRIFCINRNSARTGYCSEGIDGHVTKALCDAGSADHNSQELQNNNAFLFDFQEFIVESKTGPFNITTALSGDADYDAHNVTNGHHLQYYKVKLKPAIDGEPEFKFGSTFATADFEAYDNIVKTIRGEPLDFNLGGGLEHTISASNHRLQIYRTKNIWYDDGGSCSVAGHLTELSCTGGGGTWTAGTDAYIPNPNYHLVREVPYPSNTFRGFGVELTEYSSNLYVSYKNAARVSMGIHYIDTSHDKALEKRGLYRKSHRTPGPPPDCKYVTNYGSHLIVAGNPIAPNTVYYSDGLAPENFNVLSNFLVDDNITGIKSINRNLFIFQKDKIQVLTGDLAKDNVRLTTLASGTDIGAVSNDSIVEVKGTLFFLNQNGIFSVNSGSSEITEVSKMINPEFSKELYNFKKATAYNWTSQNLYVIYLPLLVSNLWSMESDRGVILVFDYTKASWVTWTDIRAGGGLSEYRDNIYFSNTIKNSTGLATADFEGNLNKFIIDQAWDEEVSGTLTPIDFQYSTHWESLGDPTGFKKFLRIKLFTDDSSNSIGDNKFDIEVRTDFNGGKIVGTKKDFLIGEKINSKVTKLPTGKAKAINFTFKNNVIGGVINIKGYEIEAVESYMRGEIKE